MFSGGRVIDPETGTDRVGDVGITAGRITAVGETGLAGRVVLDVSGCVVCPGFIDLHSHAQGIAEHRLQALDGVTTALELEAGAFPVEHCYARAAVEGRPINYGFSASWALARMSVLAGVKDPGGVESFFAHIAEPAWQRVGTREQVARIADLLARELGDGALGVGVLVGYAPDTALDEYLAVARVAAQVGAPTYTHSRDLVEVNPATPIDGPSEIVRAAAETGAHMHYCHINATTTRHVGRVLHMISEARAEGSKVTTEAYPYGVGMTGIGARFLAPERLAQRGLSPTSVRYAPTGKVVADVAELTELRRRDPGGLCFVENLREDDPDEFAFVEQAMGGPATIIASDAIPLHWARPAEPTAWPLPPGAVTHPRTAGTYARTLRLARERELMTLAEAIARSTLYPARVLEGVAPTMRRKGRIQVGCDADVVVFDPATVRDRATYTDTTRPSRGIVHVLVDGTFVVRDGELEPGAMPGRPVRAGVG